jgi:hypothetical protein
MIPRKIFLALLVCLASIAVGFAQDAKPSNLTPATTPSPTIDKTPVVTDEALPAGARIFIAPMPNGFETYVAAGLEKKKVPVVVIVDRDKVDYELSGVSDTDKAGWAKILFLGSQQTNEAASIKILNLKTGNIVFAYSVNKTNSFKGKQSAGEAVAKPINETIENRYH